MATTRWIDLLAATRRRVVAHARFRWALVAALAFGSIAIVDGHRRAAERERHRWSTTVAVLVAATDIPAGVTLTPDLVVRRDLPLAALPPTALTAIPPGSVALHALAPAEVLLSGHVGRSGAGRLPAGTSGVALGAPEGWSPAIGDPVAVVVSDDPVGLDVPSDEGPVEIAGTVVESNVDGVLVAVDDEDAALVAEAAASGRAVLVLRRLPSPP